MYSAREIYSKVCKFGWGLFLKFSQLVLGSLLMYTRYPKYSEKFIEEKCEEKKKDDPSPERSSPTSFLLRPMGSEKSFAWCASMTVEWWGGGGRELPTIEQLQFLAWCATTACGATVLADDFCCCYWCSSGRKECCEWNSFGVSTSGYRIAFLSRNFNFNSTNFPVYISGFFFLGEKSLGLKFKNFQIGTYDWGRTFELLSCCLG